MASFIIDSIGRLLDDLELLDCLNTTQSMLYYNLKFLRTFLICASTLGEDAHLGSLLAEIGEAVSPVAESPDGALVHVMVVIQLQVDIMSFAADINQWYATVSDSQSRFLSMQKVEDIICSLLGNPVPDDLDELSCFPLTQYVFDLNAMLLNVESLGKFIRFVEMRCVNGQELEDFVIHVAVVAINAAHVMSLHHCKNIGVLSEDSDQMQSETVKLLQKIKPFDPCAFEAYKTALGCCKHSTELQDSLTLDHLVVMEEFIDVLLWNLYEVQKMDCGLMISVEIQLRVLRERLVFLRNILQEMPHKFDEKSRELSIVVICDAGILIFLLYQKDARVDVKLADLLVQFDKIGAEVDKQVPEISLLDLTKATVSGFLNFAIDGLVEVKSLSIDSNGQDLLLLLRQDLVYLKSVLEALEGLLNQQEQVEALWSHAVQMASRIRFLTDQLVLEDLIPYSTSFDSIFEDLRIFKSKALKIHHTQEIQVEKVVVATTQILKKAPQESIALPICEVVGFENEATLLIDRLTRGAQKLQVISIVGMAGLGKTTLATKVYKSRQVMYHFHVFAWCSVSQVYNRKKLLIDLLNHILPVPGDHDDKSEDDLSQLLWQSLKGRRYLIFLDDVWDIEAWYSLKGSFPDDCNQSRILLTSRHCHAVPQAMLDAEPYLLRHLNNDESWELLQRKLSLGNDMIPGSRLYDLGKQIAQNCKGLPLIVVIVAGLLTTMDLVVWQEVLETLCSGSSPITEQCCRTLELSYRYLPCYLKPSFLYFGLFPEDGEISVRRLFWIWSAEGFIHKTELESLEDIATSYLLELVRRSLVMVSLKGSTGGIKACRVHDVLHDFCRAKAKEENFFQLFKGYDEILPIDEPYNQPRICIQSNFVDFKQSTLFRPYTHSLVLTHCKPHVVDFVVHEISFIILIFKYLKVLDIRQINLGRVFPSGLEFLVQLRYLAIAGHLQQIPSSIGKLSNLETFIVESYAMVVLPDTFWYLHKLRNLCIPRGLYFPVDNIESSSDLSELKSCSTVALSSWESYEKLLRKFPEVRKLKCMIVQNWDDENDDKILLPLSRLKSLHLLSSGRRQKLPELVQFEFSLHLVKLTLNRFEMFQSHISTIGKLPYLEVLKLIDVSLHGGIFDIKDGEFSKLIFLELNRSGVVRWTASDDDFPPLKRLVLEHCRELEEIPPCLESIPTLEMIEVSSCSESVENQVNQIQEMQMDLGNTDIQIHISPLMSHRAAKVLTHVVPNFTHLDGRQGVPTKELPRVWFGSLSDEEVSPDF